MGADVARGVGARHGVGPQSVPFVGLVKLNGVLPFDAEKAQCRQARCPCFRKGLLERWNGNVQMHLRCWMPMPPLTHDRAPSHAVA